MRQSNTNINTSMAMNMAAVPTMSARLWASSVFVSPAPPSRRLRSRPEPLLSKNPSGYRSTSVMTPDRMADRTAKPTVPTSHFPILSFRSM